MPDLVANTHVPNTQTGTLIDHEHGTNDLLIRDDGQLVLYGDAFR